MGGNRARSLRARGSPTGSMRRAHVARWTAAVAVWTTSFCRAALAFAEVRGCVSSRAGRPVRGRAGDRGVDDFYSHVRPHSALWGTYAGRNLRRGACGVSIRTVRSASITAGVVLREEAVAPPVFRRSGHRMIAITEFPRRAVAVPGLWTPGQRRAESEGRRGGRPQALGSLAGDRCRPCLRWGRETPTLPQRIVILAMISPEEEGVTSQPEYTLSKPSSCPNNRDHFTPCGGTARWTALPPSCLRTIKSP